MPGARTRTWVAAPGQFEHGGRFAATVPRAAHISPDTRPEAIFILRERNILVRETIEVVKFRIGSDGAHAIRLLCGASFC